MDLEYQFQGVQGGEAEENHLHAVSSEMWSAYLTDFD